MNLSKKKIQNFMKIRRVGVVLFHANRRTDMTKPNVALRYSCSVAPRMIIAVYPTFFCIKVWCSVANILVVHRNPR